jgi:DNA-binding HxlR family transcriptional regulator
MMRKGKRSVLSCKWALQIIILLTEGKKRPSQIMKEIDGLGERILFDRLSRLVNAGLIQRWTNGGYPRESYYYLKDPEEFLPLREWLMKVNFPLEDLVKLASCKWTLPILNSLNEPRTPSQIKKILKGISDKVLQERLRKLERLELIERAVLPTRPPTVIYSLTKNGKENLPLLNRLSTVILCKPKRHSQVPSPVRDS